MQKEALGCVWVCPQEVRKARVGMWVCVWCVHVCSGKRSAVQHQPSIRQSSPNDAPTSRETSNSNCSISVISVGGWLVSTLLPDISLLPEEALHESHVCAMIDPIRATVASATSHVYRGPGLSLTTTRQAQEFSLGSNDELSDKCQEAKRKGAGAHPSRHSNRIVRIECRIHNN